MQVNVIVVVFLISMSLCVVDGYVNYSRSVFVVRFACWVAYLVLSMFVWRRRRVAMLTLAALLFVNGFANFAFGIFLPRYGTMRAIATAGMGVLFILGGIRLGIVAHKLKVLGRAAPADPRPS